MARAATYGPVQLARVARLERWQVDRGLQQGLIPAATTTRRWSQEQVHDVAARREEIINILGEHPGYGAWRAADILQAALGEETATPDADGLTPGEVWAVDVETLAARGVLTAVGQFKGHTLYDARQLTTPPAELIDAAREAVTERLDWWQRSLTTTVAARRCDGTEEEFTAKAARAGILAGAGGRWALADVEALAAGIEAAEEIRADRLLTADQAAAHMQIRRSDLEHARTAGWLTPHTHTSIRAGHQRVVEVPLFRAADVAALHELPGVDWQEVRSTRRGRPSPLLQYVGTGKTRAQTIRTYADRLARTTGVPVYARYQPTTDRWLLDWPPNEAGHPTKTEAAQLLAEDSAQQFAHSITLLTPSGRAVHHAAHLIQPGVAIVVDTETSALDGSIIELAAADAATGELLLDTLIAPPPGVRINPQAEAIHGISPGMLTGAPTLDKIWPQLHELTAGKTVLAYNTNFDYGRLRHDADQLNLPTSHLTRPATWGCLMELHGTWTGTTTWLPLGTIHHRPEDGPAHRAAADTRAAVRLLHTLAAPPPWWR